MASAAKVELYNIIGKINGRTCAVANGWKVARYEGSRRVETLKDCGRDEQAARAYAGEWNQIHDIALLRAARNALAAGL